MKRLQYSMLVTALLATASLEGGAPVIGTVISSTAFRLNGDTVISNGTLMEGAVLETGRTDSSVQLSSGARVTLGPASRARLHRDRMILEKGDTRVDSTSDFRLEALGLTVRPGGAAGSGRIGLEGSRHLRVAALAGSLRVSNARGILVANVAAGSTLTFEPQTPASPDRTRITGVLTRAAKEGHFLLTDQVTHVTVEITGPELEMYVGLTVEVTGTLDAAVTPVTGASQVIAATSVRVLGTKRAGGAGVPGKSGGAGGAGSGGGAAPAASGGAGIGISVGTIAIIGGVAAAATLGGLAASDGLPGQGSPPAPISR